MTIGAEDPPFAGGSYVIVQKYLHDMAAWDALTVEEQERVIGRAKLSNVEMDDDVKPSNSHVALNTIIEPDGTQRQILRENMPFGSLGAGEFGTYFIGYAATPSVTELMLAAHVPRGPARQLRPDPRLLHRGDRHPVLRAHCGLPRRPSPVAGRGRCDHAPGAGSRPPGRGDPAAGRRVARDRRAPGHVGVGPAGAAGWSSRIISSGTTHRHRGRKPPLP